jgi:hypothetical protein
MTNPTTEEIRAEVMKATEGKTNEELVGMIVSLVTSVPPIQEASWMKVIKAHKPKEDGEIPDALRL